MLADLKTAAEVLEVFENIRRGQRAGVYAPHKPLLLLLALAIAPNGLSLCALHHKLFDLGAFTVEPTEQRVVFSQHAARNHQ